MKSSSMMREDKMLEHLTLDKVFDAAYLCGMNNTPVFILLSGPPGIGKTWAAKGIKDAKFVQYINTPSSPNEHRKKIIREAARTRLLIHDDFGLAKGWKQGEYLATFSMIADGMVQFTMYKTLQRACVNCSMIITCTSAHYAENVDVMESMGLLRRVIPIVVGISAETREIYQEYRLKTNILDKNPLPRNPVLREIRNMSEMTTARELIMKHNVNPSLLDNLINISQFLTDEGLLELIEVAHNPLDYSI